MSYLRRWMVAVLAAVCAMILGALPSTALGRALVRLPLTPGVVPGLAGTPFAADLPDVTSPSGAACENFYFPVYETAGDVTVYKVFGQLCTMDPAKLGRQPVQVLIHGGTYNHAYFDWPHEPKTYSYVRYATLRGFTTLNIDRLGYGLSDHPAGPTLNFDVAAFVTHQLVDYLRQGALGRHFGTIVLNGFSMGGLTAQVEASSYNDVNAIITHAVGHDLQVTPALTQAFYPASLDPKFASDAWAATGYLTSIPGQRTLFYGPPGTYDPEQLVYEEALKDTMAATELTDIAVKSSEPTITVNIKRPVLWTLGRYDKIWCVSTNDCTTDPEVKDEPSFYRPGMATIQVVPNAGHSVVTGYGGPKYWFPETIQWLASNGIHGNP